MRSILGGILVVFALFGFPGAGAAAPPDPFTGTWVLDDGAGSTSWTHIAAAGADGVREVAVFDTYARFCETAGAGTGSPLNGRAYAVTAGAQIKITFTSVHCVNGSPGAVQPPFTTLATLTGAGLDFGFGFVATRPGGGTGAATGERDPLTGSWVLDDGDGSTSWTHFSAAGADGLREVAAFDTYATFCETAGVGTGSQLNGRGYAFDDGTHVLITVTSVHCANGSPGAVAPPFTIVATLTNAGLDFGAGFVATRVGRS